MTVKVTVAFLARGRDGGLDAVAAFLESYVRFSAGEPHRLVFLAKGWEGVSGYDRLSEMATSVGGEVINLPDDGYDWGAYFRLAAIAKTEFLCLLNTHSRILRNNWVARLYAQIQRPEIGLVGCSGSWGTIGWTWPLYLHRMRERWHEGRRAKASILAGWVALRYCYSFILNRRYFPDFPNPHIRSNAFMIRTAHLREFALQSRMPTTKRDAHKLESGHKGLSRFIEAKNLGMLLCGADGASHLPDRWADSGIFCCPGQRNLLISDNLTREYEERTPQQKRQLELALWGRILERDGGET
jgi:hypothetical protein